MKKVKKQILSFVLALAVSMAGSTGLTALAAGTDMGFAVSDEGAAEIAADGETALDMMEASTDWYGDGTETEYTIGSADELIGLSDLVSGGEDFSGKTITLTADIDLTADDYSSFAGIGTSTKAFAGTFDGDGHTVTMAITSTQACTGLFAYVTGATIRNVTTAGSVTSTGTTSTGALIGRANKSTVTVKNCVNQAAVTGKGSVGGIIGDVKDGTILTISGCSNTAAIASGYTASSGTFTYSAEAGGIAGWVKGDITITYCMNSGDISGKTDVGGIVGYCYGANACSVVISDCVNQGNVTGSSTYGGGIAGYLYLTTTAATVLRCGNEGDVSATRYVGGIVGYSTHSSASIQVFENVYNAGDITGSYSSAADYVGGIVGNVVQYEYNIIDAYNVGTVTDSKSGTYVGGIIGGSSKSSATPITLTNVYSAGAVTAAAGSSSGYILVGYGNSNTITLSNVYYLATLSGSLVNTGTVEGEAAEKTADELTGLAATLGTSFASNTAGSEYHSGYPVLAWELEDTIYQVNENLKNLTGSGTAKIRKGYDYETTLTADSVYLLSDSVTISVGGDDLASDDYTYNSTTGEITIAADIITGDITITAEGVCGHSWDSAVTTEATCTEDGVLTYTCTVCGETYTESIPAAGHSYEETVVEPTYTAGGYTLYVCSVCGDSYRDAETDALSDLIISTEDELAAFAESVNAGTDYSGKVVALAADLDMTGDSYADFSGVGTAGNPFAGTFEGEGHMVKLALSTSTGSLGLFSYVNGAAIENVVTEGSVTNTYYYRNSENVTTEGTGGLVGYVCGTDGLVVTNCTNRAAVSGDNQTGGLVGNAVSGSTVTVSGCVNEGTVSSTGLHVGGIIGVLYGGSISGCENTGSVESTNSASDFVGGIAGRIQDNTGDIEITRCINRGDITGQGTYYVGGIAGLAISNSSYSIVISECGNEGAVTCASGGTVGGIAGERRAVNTDDEMSSLYNTGTVTGKSSAANSGVGGIVGTYRQTGSGLQDVYNQGKVINNGTASSVGGIVGTSRTAEIYLTNAYTVGETYYNSDTAGSILLGNATNSAYVFYLSNVYYLDSLTTALANVSCYIATDSTATSYVLETDESVTSIRSGMAQSSGNLEGLAATLGDSFTDNTQTLHGNSWPILEWETEVAEFTVTENLIRLSSSSIAETLSWGESYSTTLTADEDYILPETVTVTVGVTKLTQGEDGYSYDSETGELAIPAVLINGDIVITASAVQFYALE